MSEDISLDKDDPRHMDEWMFLELEGEGREFACSPRKKTVYIDFSTIYSGVTHPPIDSERFMLFNFVLYRYQSLMEMLFHNLQHEDLHITLGHMFGFEKKHENLPDVPEVMSALFWLDGFIEEDEISQVVKSVKRRRAKMVDKNE